MWWDSIGGAFVGMTENSQTNASIGINNRLGQLNADSSNKVRQASNALSAAQGSFARWSQSVSNNRRLTAGGNQLEASVMNYRRERDNLGKQSFSDSIRQAEQQGASAAAQAAAGIDGSVVDMVNGATALRDALVAENLKAYGETVDYDAAHRAGAITLGTVQGLDGSLVLDMLDMNVDVFSPQKGYSRTAAIMRGMASSQGVQPDGKKPNAEQNDYKATSGDGVKFSFEGEKAGNYFEKQQSYDTQERSQVKFGYETTSTDKEHNPYALWNSDQSTKFGDQDANKSSSFWNF